jgi:hypothetical protein
MSRSEIRGGALIAALFTFALAAPAAEGQLSSAGLLHLEQGLGGFPGAADGWDSFGSALAAGDFDGDGRPDLAIGAETESIDAGDDLEGRVHVLSGTEDGPDPGSAVAWSLDGTIFAPGDTLDLFGTELATGDFDGDGRDDLAIGIPFRDALHDGGTVDDAGGVLVLYGSDLGLGLLGHQMLRQGADGLGGVPEESDWFGAALASGDFNADGYDDLAIGVYGEDVGAISGAGAVNVIFGSASGLSTTAAVADQLWTQSDTDLSTDEAGDWFGWDLAVGDFDGDGDDDLAVGVPGERVDGLDGAGAVLTLYGTGIGLVWGPSEFLTEAGAVPGEPAAGDRFGTALAAGDFDGDGRDDLAIGVPNQDHLAGILVPDVGAAVLLRGSASGISSSGGFLLDRFDSDGLRAANDHFGTALAAGDFDGDGRSDLAVSIRGATVDAVQDAGKVAVFAGAPTGVEPTFAVNLSQSGMAATFPEENDEFGSVLATGDFDADGYDDLAVGVPGDSAGGFEDAGMAHVFVSQGLFRDGFETGNAGRWSGAVSN